MTKAFSLDLETFSEFDISNGAFPYAEHASTGILLLGVARHGEEPRLWLSPELRGRIPGVEHDPESEITLQEIQDADDVPVYAHNAEFEQAVTTQHFTALGWSAPIHPSRWRCTAAMGRKAGFRSKLAHLSEDLNLDQKKYATGKSLIPLFCCPLSGRELKKYGPRCFLWQEPEKAKLFAEYCLQDVRAEMEIADKLAPFDLRGRSLEVFQLTGRLNSRGVPVNVPALRNAQKIIDEVEADVGARFFTLVGAKHTQRAVVFAWLRARGYTGEDMTADTVEEQLARTDWKAPAYTGTDPDGAMGHEALVRMYEDGRTALQLYSLLAYAAAKKVTAMLNSVCRDGTVKGTLLYHGAGTGRWSGRGIQPQNFKKPTIKGDLEMAFSLIEEGCSREAIELAFGPALEVIASVIRNFIGLSGGILDADYNAVEARIANWVAGQRNILELFQRMDSTPNWSAENDIYLIMYSETVQCPVKRLPKKGFQRTFGKVLELGAQYGLGEDGIIRTGEGWGIVIPPELAAQGKAAYRRTHDQLPRIWKAFQKASIRAVKTPEVWHYANKDGLLDKPNAGLPTIAFRGTNIAGIPYLLMRLPSGRTIAYPRPEVKTVWVAPRKVGQTGFESEELTYFGQIPGKSIMGRIKLPGYKSFENACQAIAGDLMANGALEAEADGFDLLTLIHDQALAANDPRGAKAFVAALTRLPDWAKGLPLAAEGDWAPFYRKD